MEAVFERCCGVDVHKKMIVACLRVGRGHETREFGTSSSELREMANWLLSNDCQMTAMESTGSYWKPVYNVLEVLGVEVIVVNAHHIKNVPGRKTDVKDAEWIAELLQHGLVKPGFIPDRAQRELREVARYRKSLVEERAREINRLEKTLQGANIKLYSVVSDITGKSSRNIIDALAGEGISEENIDSKPKGSLRKKRDDLLRCCDGYLTPLQRKLVRAILDHIDDMTRRIADIDQVGIFCFGDCSVMLRTAAGMFTWCQVQERREMLCCREPAEIADFYQDGQSGMRSNPPKAAQLACLFLITLSHGELLDPFAKEPQQPVDVLLRPVAFPRLFFLHCVYSTAFLSLSS